MVPEDIKFQEDYKYGFKDEDVSILKTEKGLTEETVRQISAYKNEPEWMLEFRLKALKAFNAMPLPIHISLDHLKKRLRIGMKFLRQLKTHLIV